jgi:hypothetical protein
VLYFDLRETSKLPQKLSEIAENRNLRKIIVAEAPHRAALVVNLTGNSF